MANGLNNHNHRHTHFHIVIVVLLLLALFIFARHFIRQTKWNMYVVHSQQTVRYLKSLNSVEDSNIIAASITSVPAENPLLKQPKALETYIQKLSGQMQRDIVIVDTSKKILADTVSANVGKTYAEDRNNEIKNTMGYSLPRDFVEQSIDYPSGVAETVVALKDAHGATLGAIVISNSTIFNK